MVVTEPKTVLLVDDDHKMHTLLAAALEPEFRVLTADDGESALASVRAQRPDLILMDVNMPRLDGIAACRQLKADPALCTIPVFMVTGQDRDDYRRETQAAGAEAYITKPFSLVAVLTRVRERLSPEGARSCNHDPG